MIGDPVAAIVGGRIVGPNGIAPGDVVIGGERIKAIGRAADDHDGEVLDARGLLVAPGFVDLQCNGAMGLDLTRDPIGMWDVAVALPQWGVTSWLPTIVTAPRNARDTGLTVLRDGPSKAMPPHASPLGLHFEGPYLASVRAGAHRRELLGLPDADEVASWSRDAGVAVVTLAPELPGALALVKELTARGVVVSAGHSDATAEEATESVDAGVRMVTHLFNGMGPMHHRAPGLPGVALTDARLTVGLIADGVHVDRTMVAVAATALGSRLALVTDAVGALGAPGGPLRVGDLDVAADGGGVRLSDGTLAGTDLSMDRAVRNLREFSGWATERVVAAATSVPASAIGADDRGRLVPGAIADVVLLTDELDVVATVCAGVLAWSR